MQFSKIFSGIVFLLNMSIQPALSQVNSTFMRTFRGGGMNGGLALEATMDGGFIGTGQHESSGAGSCDMYIYKVNDCGDPEWFKTYGSGSEDGGKWVKQTADGGYILAGLTHFGAGAYDQWLMKIDPLGNIQWNKTFGAGGNDYALYVNTTSDGGYVMTGFFENIGFGSTDVSLIKTDGAGNVQWTKIYGGGGADWGDYVEQTSDGGYIITAYTTSYGAGGKDVYMLKTDASGNLLWSKTFGSGSDDSQEWGNFGGITSDGGYIVCSHTNGAGAGNYDFWVFKTDATGNVQWSKTYGGAGEESSRHIEPTPDGGFIVAGYGSSWGMGGYDAYFVKIDASGNHQWSKVYGGNGIDRAVGIRNTIDGGYAMSLLSTSFGADYFDPVFMKSDEQGNVGCNEAVAGTIVNDFNPVVTSPASNSGVPNITITSPNVVVATFAPVDNFLCFNCITVPDFVASDTLACIGETIDFYNTTSIGQRCYQEWEVNGQVISGIDTMSYTFNAPGIYTVSLLSRCGLSSDTISASVLVLPDPVADFTFSNVCQNQPVVFNDQSSTTPFLTVLTSWAWDFGDGSGIAMGANQTHQYAAPGTYDVTLTVTNNQDCSNTITKQVVIHPVPVADFTTADVCDGNAVNFQDNSSVLTGNITQWNWDFGDSQNSSTQNNSHFYLAPGQYNVTLTVTTDNNCTASQNQTVNSFPLPEPSFTVANACLNIASVFTNTSSILSGSITNHNWSFGDGNTSAFANPVNTYTAPGTYTITLIETSNQNCVDSVSQQVTVYPLPVADFSFTDTCQGVSVQFNDLSTVSSGNITQWNWTFGGNGNSTLQNPSHSFTQPGTFNVELKVSSGFGCADSITYTVVAYPNPVADFTYSNSCFGDMNTFTNTSSIASGNISVYQWNFGSGITSGAQDTSFIYPTPGVYNITLDAESNFGCRNSVSHSLEVFNNPIADFSTTDVCQNFAATFTNLSTSLSGSINSWRWNLDDGTIMNNTVSIPVNHNYANPGTYNVELIVTTQHGCDDTIVKPIVIHPVPVADFSFDIACFGSPTSFTDLSNVSSGSVTGWNWNFNGTTVNGNPNPQFTFPQPGLHGVVLTVTTDNGCTSQSEHSVLVHPLPQPAFSFTKVCFGETTTFTNTSTIANGNSIASYLWSFGDGTISNLFEPVHIFSPAGFYDVTLICTSNNQCIDSITHSVEVYPLPQTAFSAVPDSGCQPLAVTFTDLSTIPSGYNINQWRWEFGDGAISGSQNTIYVYDTAGTFTVSLTATSNQLCSLKVTEPNIITVFPKPNAAFTFHPQPTTIVYPFITFTDLSSVLTGNIISWNYDLGDGNISTEQHPTHTYRDTLTYYVQQIVTTDQGCSDTVTHAIVIDPEFTLYVPTAFTPDGDGINDEFLAYGIGIKHITLRVFNRWGEMLFFSDNLYHGWNGQRFNDGKLCEGAVYVYFIEITDVNNWTYEFKGIVTLVR